MEEIIALLKFAVDNEHNFTEHDPDGVKRAWIEQARKALAAAQSVQADLLPCGHSKENQRWSLPECVEYCAACAATSG